jgi:transcriptional regulator with XRE-family HTH domain
MDRIAIPPLVKRLRQRLGLTQEQLAHEVGVTFSTVNQWENGRRRPQPFLLRRLLEMEAGLDPFPGRPVAATYWATQRVASTGEKAPVGHLTRSAAQDFQRRWQRVNAAEREELSFTPVAHKFRQLAALLASAGALGWTAAPAAAEEGRVRLRWARLRRMQHA